MRAQQRHRASNSWPFFQRRMLFNIAEKGCDDTTTSKKYSHKLMLEISFVSVSFQNVAPCCWPSTYKVGFSGLFSWYRQTKWGLKLDYGLQFVKYELQVMRSIIGAVPLAMFYLREGTIQVCDKVRTFAI